MKGCDGFESNVQAVIEGSPDFGQLEAIVEHCRTCRDCRELFDLHHTLGSLGSRFDEMEDAHLDRTRAEIIRRVAGDGRKRSPWKRISALWAPFQLQPLAATAMLATVFALGFTVSRIGDRSPSPDREPSTETLISESLRDIGNSPYIFSNVAVKELSSDKVSLVLDITRRVEIVQPPHSELVKGILTHSLGNPYTTGAVGHFQSLPSREKTFY